MAAVANSATNRTVVKKWLHNSGIYENVIGIVVETMSSQMSNANIAPESIDSSMDSTDSSSDQLAAIFEAAQDPSTEIGRLVSEKYNAQFFETTSNTVIDATYDWLEGKSDNIDFRIELADSQDDLLDLMNAAFKEKFTSMPACTAEDQIPVDINGNFDPFSASCLPEGFDINSIDAQLEEQMNTPELQDMLNNATLTSQNFNIDAATTHQAQQTYHWAVLSPYIMIAASGILVILLFFFIPGLKAKFITPSIFILIPSSVLLILALLGTTIFNFCYNFAVRQMQTFSESSTVNLGTAETIVRDLLLSITKDINSKIVIYAIIAIGIAVVLFIIGLMTSLLKKKEAVQAVQAEPAKQPSVVTKITTTPSAPAEAKPAAQTTTPKATEEVKKETK